MSKKAPGKANREGISLTKLIRMFPDDDTSRKWIESVVWPDGPYCPSCGTFNVQSGIKHKTMTHRCRECTGKPRFSVKTGTVMQSSKLGYQIWAIAAYLVTTNLKGVSSMKLHRDLEITQKSAWHLAHRLRKAYEAGHGLFNGPVEADESHWGGKRRNMSNAKRKELKDTGRGTVGKTAVAGVKDRETNKVVARVVESVDKPTLQGFVRAHAKPGATLYTDESGSYAGMPEYHHEAVNHSVSEFVRDMASTNGMESFWSMVRRGHHGTFHKFSPKHLDRYVAEFSGRHNVRSQDTIEQMGELTAGMIGKRLRYKDLIADNGLDSGARS
ncbi:MAG: IS1595 family transposase [bacterium]|nr:IS1595 family transposase [bacterium]